MPSRPRGRAAGRVVRKILADGTEKIYHYGPHRPERPAPDSKSLATLIEAWQDSPEWRGLAETTKQNYSIYIRDLFEVRHIHFTYITKKHIITARNAIASTRGNGAASGFKRAVSALFGWAVDNGWLEQSPVWRIKNLPGGSLPVWTEEEIRVALARLPEPLRRVVVLGLHTGQRRGDLCRLPWSAYDGTAIRLTQEKTRTSLTLPCHPELKAELDSWRAGADAAILTILTDDQGRPWKPTYLSHKMRWGLAKIGLRERINVHGLRKLAATKLADAGCTPHEIAAVTGHRTLAMVQYYTTAADQERLASAAFTRLQGRKT